TAIALKAASSVIDRRAADAQIAPAAVGQRTVDQQIPERPTRLQIGAMPIPGPADELQPDLPARFAKQLADRHPAAFDAVAPQASKAERRILFPPPVGSETQDIVCP